MAKHNYKQKWLDALEGQRKDPKQSAEAHLHTLAENGLAQTNLNLTLQRISSVTGEVAHVARSLGSCFDETKNVAGLNFGEFVSEIDNKISTLPIHTVLRRVRDVMRVAEMRIGVISARCEELYEANEQYEARLDSLKTSNGLAMRTLMATEWVGPNPTRDEIDEFTTLKEGHYKRGGLDYEDLDDAWFERNLFADAVLRVPALMSDADADSGDDSQEEAVRAMSVTKNRRAQVVPRSVIAARNNHDDLN